MRVVDVSTVVVLSALHLVSRVTGDPSKLQNLYGSNARSVYAHPHSQDYLSSHQDDHFHDSSAGPLSSVDDSETLSFVNENSAADEVSLPLSGVTPVTRNRVNQGVFEIVGDIFGHVITITEVVTKDFFKTVTNVIYNSIPVTLTDFVKTTVSSPVTTVIATPQNARVFVSTEPVSVTSTLTVTDTTTKFQCTTRVATVTYVVTHSAYNFNQQVVTSTFFRTKVYRPTIVSTRIHTEYETQTEYRTETNTVDITLPRFTSIPESLLPLEPHAVDLRLHEQKAGIPHGGYYQPHGAGYTKY